jgi:hypothetical protein
MLSILNSIAFLAIAGFLIFVFIILFPFSLIFLFLLAIAWLVLSSIVKAFLRARAPKYKRPAPPYDNIIDIN